MPTLCTTSWTITGRERGSTCQNALLQRAVRNQSHSQLLTLAKQTRCFWIPLKHIELYLNADTWIFRRDVASVSVLLHLEQ